MRAYVIVSGAIFGVLAAVHVWRMVVERSVLHDPVFVGVTVFAAAMSVWAWRVAARANAK